jgi:hypothetical protein
MATESMNMLPVARYAEDHQRGDEFGLSGSLGRNLQLSCGRAGTIR